MRNKERTIAEEAADEINDAVEDLTLKVAGTAVERNAERTTKSSSFSESASLPKHIDPASSVRAARERQSYIEQIVATAAASAKQVKNKPRATKKRRPTLRADAR
jgi:hypothetical protein